MKKLTLLGLACCAALFSHKAAAQGCEPIRFITPIDLGSEGQAYQRTHQLQFTLAYRRLHSDQFFVGTTEDPTRAPGGLAPRFDIHTLIANVAYSISDRLTLSVGLPFSTASISRKWADSAIHQQRATGIGDLSAMGELWLLNPKSHQNGNIAVGLGLKAPTGSHTKASTFYTATSAVAFPADQTVQPGDGGWGISLQAQAFQRVREGLYVYGFGSYLANPRDSTDVALAPAGPTAPYHWSVPDVYQARLGAAFSVWPDQGLTLSLGGRVDGIPRTDLFGGGDSTVRRSSVIFYADPGLSLNRGKSSFTLSVPIRLYLNRTRSPLESRSPAPPKPLDQNGGGFARYLAFVSYTYRL